MANQELLVRIRDVHEELAGINDDLNLAAESFRRSLASRMFSPKRAKIRRCLGSNGFSALISMYCKMNN